MSAKLQGPSTHTFHRTFPLEDISIRAESDGRTVEAYCAVFDRWVEVEDWEGHYEEGIRPGAFAKTIRERGSRFGVFYNHAKTVHGVSSAEFSMPLGSPVEVKEDSKGVLTVTRYAKTPLADNVLELIANGAIRAQSFSGTWMNSRVIKATRAGQLDRVERLEVAMKEFGPCPFPVYDAAAIVGVRGEDLSQLPPDERLALARSLVAGTPLEAAFAGTSDEPPTATSDDTPPPAGVEPPATGPSLDILLRQQEQRRRRLSA